MEHDQHVDCRIFTSAKTPVCLLKPTANVLEGHFRCPMAPIYPPHSLNMIIPPHTANRSRFGFVDCCIIAENRPSSCTSPSRELLRDAVPAHSTAGAMQFTAQERSPILIWGKRTTGPSKIAVDCDSDMLAPPAPGRL